VSTSISPTFESAALAANSAAARATLRLSDVGGGTSTRGVAADLVDERRLSTAGGGEDLIAVGDEREGLMRELADTTQRFVKIDDMEEEGVEVERE
jgi:hypothetical protein